MDNNWKLTKFNAVKSIIAVLMIIGFMLWRKLYPTTRAQNILNSVREDEFFGRIDSVFRDKRDHNIQKVRLANGYIYELYPEWESKVETGDSLSKLKGSTTVVVIKKDATKINLDYKELVKTFKNEFVVK